MLNLDSTNYFVNENNEKFIVFFHASIPLQKKTINLL